MLSVMRVFLVRVSVKVGSLFLYPALFAGVVLSVNANPQEPSNPLSHNPVRPLNGSTENAVQLRPIQSEADSLVPHGPTDPVASEFKCCESGVCYRYSEDKDGAWQLFSKDKDDVWQQVDEQEAKPIIERIRQAQQMAMAMLYYAWFANFFLPLMCTPFWLSFGRLNQEGKSLVGAAEPSKVEEIS